MEANDRTKYARYQQPIVIVKKGFGYDLVLTSFQSTSSCNIMNVNAINANSNFVEARARGRRDKKRHYVIEQNAARLLYLKSYSRIDSMDHLIKNCKMKYRTWKYWHSPANHAKALATCVAYDMYLECCEGELDDAWKNDDPADFHTFRDILSRQMLAYDPRNQVYPGDEKMRAVTEMNKKRRAQHKIVRDGSKSATPEQFRAAKRTKRFPADLQKYEKHLQKLTSTKHAVKCFVCGENTYKKCGVCGVALHHFDNRVSGKNKN